MSLVLIVYVALSVPVAAAKTFIDVSHWQGVIDWQRVRAAGISLAVTKATEGNCFQDTKFLTNWQGMRSNNMSAAAYHYLRGNQSAASQLINLKYVLYGCGFDTDTDVLAIDVEQTNNEDVPPDRMAHTLNSMLRNLRKNISNLFIYTGPYYWENNVSWNLYDFSVYDLWIAEYSGETPVIPTSWRNRGYTWWQYTDEGKVDGITGYVDMDRTNNSLA